MAASATLRQAAILAGGLATRLGGLAADTPKPLLQCGDRPFLAWLLRELSRYGVEEVLLLTGHLSARVADAVAALAASVPHPLRIVLNTEPAPAGTGGALWHARGLLDDRFLLLNGDSLLDGNLAGLLAAAANDPAEVLARLALHDLAEAGRSGVVERDGDRVTAFRARPPAGGPGTINAGVYVLDRRILDRLRPVCSLERDVVPGLATAGKVRGTQVPGWFIDIGIPSDLARARSDLAGRLRRPALFFDRDGVLNVDHGHVGSLDRFEWIPGAREAIHAATQAGWHVFVVTNQSGVARGLYDEAAVQVLHAWMADEARAAGGTIDDVRYCPFHPEAPLAAYRRDSDWRKPRPGMLLDLLRVWEVAPARAVLIGDQPTDLQAAMAAGVASVRFTGGDLRDVVVPILSQGGVRRVG
jgi:D-glycero-D-manno-heptose 1,7-bisphosphate phosphatase